MSLGRSTALDRFDPLKTAIAVFAALGVVLTAVGGYAVLRSVGAVPVLTVEAGMGAVFGLALVATALAVGRAAPNR